MVRFVIALAAMFLAGAVTASAQSYPQRAVRFILPFGPAAGVDITARLLADKLSTRWGKPVVVENRPGGDGLVAINAFISANDDHTLLFVPASTYTAHPYSHEKLPYDAERDLQPIVNVTHHRDRACAPESLNVKSLAEFVALARAKPDTLNVAAAAGNSDLILTSFVKTQNLPVARVPYRDIQQAPNDLAEEPHPAPDVVLRHHDAAGPSRQAPGAGGDQPQARRHRDRRSDSGRGGLPLSRTGQPDRHVRPARHAECVAREHRGRRPGRDRGRSDHRAAGWRRPARSSISAARPNSPPASRRSATSSPTSPRCSASRPRNKRSNRRNEGSA